jgi:CheY-like chemotaxis protein
VTARVSILHLEDVDADAELIQEMLTSQGVSADLRRVDSRADYESALAAGGVDLILADHSLPGDGRLALRLASERCPEVPFLFVSGSIGEELAVELLKEGSTDYVFKEHLSRLAPAVQRALKEAEERKARRRGLGEGAGQGIETIRKPHTATELLGVLARLLGRT